jgi:hypothetical protein
MDPEKLIKYVDKPDKVIDSLNSLLTKIPAEGMDWKQIRQLDPKLDQIPEIKKFAASRKKVLPEDVAEELKRYAPDRYTISYTAVSGDAWAGQQHNPGDNRYQIAIQVNNSKNIEAELTKDPKLSALYKAMQIQCNDLRDNKVGCHPSTPFSISWARVDTSQGKNGWIIEEIQSDLEHYWLDSFESLSKNPDLGNYTAAELGDYKNKIKGMIKDWELAQMRAVEELARRHGVVTIYMHGHDLRIGLSGYSGDSENIPHGFAAKYDKLPKKLGFESCDYSEYPNAHSRIPGALKDHNLNTQCWKKKLS